MNTLCLVCEKTTVSRVKQVEQRSRSSSMSMSRYHLPLMRVPHPSHSTCTAPPEEGAIATRNKWDSCTCECACEGERACECACEGERACQCACEGERACVCM